MDSLLAIIQRRIATRGPLRVDEYMALALGHPRCGYYMRGDPLGQAGDFITAPEISQMFGELIGLWCGAQWQQMGRPRPVILAELGPGRGTLIADALRAVARAMPAFAVALRVHLVETSPPLRERQRQTLAAARPGLDVTWHRRFESIPEGPLLLVANEFFDALPIRQYRRIGRGWRERRITAGKRGGGLQFIEVAVTRRPPALPRTARALADGELIEVCPAGRRIARRIGERVSRCGGAALVIDYGHAISAPGDTLQAVRRHARHPALERPGEADLTAHVDFQALAEAARTGGAAIFGPVPQGALLARLGIDARARALAAAAEPERVRDIEAAYRRLVHPRRMGTLFKALAIAAPTLPPPPGFLGGER